MIRYFLHLISTWHHGPCCLKASETFWKKCWSGPPKNCTFLQSQNTFFESKYTKTWSFNFEKTSCGVQTIIWTLERCALASLCCKMSNHFRYRGTWSGVGWTVVYTDRTYLKLLEPVFGKFTTESKGSIHPCLFCSSLDRAQLSAHHKQWSFLQI